MYKLQEPVESIWLFAMDDGVGLVMEALTKALAMAFIVVEALSGDE